MSIRLSTKWLWVRVQLQSLKLQVSPPPWTRSSMLLFSVNWTQSSILGVSRSSLKYVLYLTFLDTTFWSNRFCSFVQATVIIISLLLCLARYSLLTNILHPSKRCCNVSLCSLHSLHWLFLVSLMTFFQALVPVIGFDIDKMDVFLGVKFCSGHILDFLFYFLYISPCISFLLYCSSLFSSLPFLKHSFFCFHVG